MVQLLPCLGKPGVDIQVLLRQLSALMSEPSSKGCWWCNKPTLHRQLRSWVATPPPCKECDVPLNAKCCLIIQLIKHLILKLQ